MPLTRDFRRTVQARATRDHAFGNALFREAVQTLLQGDFDAGRASMRDYINQNWSPHPIPAGHRSTTLLLK